MGERHRLAALRKQVHRRRAPQRQRVVGQRALQFRQRTVQIDKDFHPISPGCEGFSLHSGEIQEQELLREGEIFGQQAKAREAAGGPGEQRLLRPKADRADRISAHDDGVGVGRAVGVGDRQRVAAQQFVQRQGDVGRRAQVETQPVNAELREGDLGVGAFHHDAQRRHRAAGQRVGRHRERQAGEPHALDLHRPQRHRIGGAEAAWLAAHRLAVQRQAGRDLERHQQVRLAAELQHRAGGHRRQVMRVEHAEQRVGQLRKLVVQPVMDAGRQEGHAVEQPLHMRVVHRVAGHAQAARDLGVRFGEFLRQLADSLQLAVEIGQQCVRHRAAIL